MKIVFIAVALISVFAALAFIVPFSERSFEIKDRCGRIAGSILHSIEDASMCSTQCKSQCSAEGYGRFKINFEIGQICNSCNCSCTKTLLP